MTKNALVVTDIVDQTSSIVSVQELIFVGFCFFDIKCIEHDQYGPMT